MPLLIIVIFLASFFTGSGVSYLTQQQKQGLPPGTSLSPTPYATPDPKMPIVPFCAFNVLPELYRDKIQSAFGLPIEKWEKKGKHSSASPSKAGSSKKREKKKNKVYDYNERPIVR